MPLVLHLRWNSLTAEQRSAVDQLVADAVAVPGCWSFTSAADGRSLRATAVWDGEDTLNAFADGPLADVSAAAGLLPPQTALFAVPDLFAAGYRPHRSVAVVPAPRPVSEAALGTPVRG